MGAIGGLLGMAGGAGGSGFSGPQASGAGTSGIYNPTSVAQLGTAYGGVQGAQTAQQNLLSALQGQNGLGNQSQNYNQLQGVINGTGPNPAQAMLAQQTGQNVAQQGALMAGQRGAASNVGLMARQAAQQGAATQQQAVGQGATMQAQQSLNAIGQAGQMANTQAGQQIGQTNANTAAQQAEQAALINAQLGVNNSNVGIQSNINSVNGQLANTQMQGGQGLIGGLMNGASSVLSSLADGGDVEPISTTNSEMSPQNGQLLSPTPAAPAPGPQSMFGKFLKGAVKKDKGPGTAPASGAQTGPQALKEGTSNLVQALAGLHGSSDPSSIGQNEGDATNAPAGPMGNFAAPDDSGDDQPLGDIDTPEYAKGGRVPALVSPGERFLKPKDVKEVAKGKKSPMKAGETIPGKPKVGGAKNSYANDTVPKKLEVGGIVLPRSVTQSKNPEKDAAAFVRDVLAKRKRK
jgi:hypothetical protein